MNDLFLTGRDASCIVTVPELAAEVHADIVAPLKQLKAEALAAGQTLAIASAYRGFDRQLKIWNEKVSGQRPVLNAQGRVLNLAAMSDWEKIQSILTWSALPGASRHHWGTDLDVFNPDCLPDGYRLQLTQAEYEHGVQCDFNRWLSAQLSTGNSAFYRPYQRFTGGVLPEPWHISYRPLADQYQAALTTDLLADTLMESDLNLKSTVLNHLDEIVQRYVHIVP